MPTAPLQPMFAENRRRAHRVLDRLHANQLRHKQQLLTILWPDVLASYPAGSYVVLEEGCENQVSSHLLLFHMNPSTKNEGKKPYAAV